MVMQFTSIVLSSSFSIHTLKILGQNHRKAYTWPIVWLKYSHLKRVKHMQICFVKDDDFVNVFQWLLHMVSCGLTIGLSLIMFVYVGPYGFEGHKYITYGFDKYLGDIDKVNKNQICKGK